MKIGDIIRKARREKNISQKELGKKIGVSKTSISAWEKGKKEPKSRNFLKCIEILKINNWIEETINVQPANLPVQQ